MSNELSPLEINEIMELLPHRYPFLLIDKVIDFEVGKSLHAVKNVTINEPFFQGHFPIKPIMPGVLLLEAMAQATGVLGFKTIEKSDDTLYYFAAIDNARFKQPVVPGDVVHIHVEYLKERRGIGKFYCEAKVDGKVVCSADLMCARKD
ncbi:3-hydroxyacyl-ACP dehydratase FabZ [Psychrobium sp. MM17-31]|uniref:3-hydroxyacyl-ACP dehydratase FabZ n=1 Tax=Psychrobium sp. MM17-31 TaxID=2917758 RepID=UPI001EF67266|nr:3-hydroxyacyl-ACP dehydratase FabZ [Psychrobium sp. MM17-31]MCG7530233.1 3-hydroxyacyl-ACP dehydratase FabZ [Psychrobium sp. MM17-31]